MVVFVSNCFICWIMILFLIFSVFDFVMFLFVYNSFIYISVVVCVIFGVGSLQYLVCEIDLLGVCCVFVFCMFGQCVEVECVVVLIGECCVGIFDQVVMYVFIEIVCYVCEVVCEFGVDCVIVIGGGFIMGLGKVIVLEFELFILVILIIYVGSEMMFIYGIIEVGFKKIGCDVCVLLCMVIYDFELSVGLLLKLLVISGINVMVYVVEGFYVVDVNFIMLLLVEEGLCVLVEGLLQLVVCSDDLVVCSQCLYGVWLCGMVLGNVGMLLYYKLCYMLGGSYNLLYVEMYIVILLYVLVYNVLVVLEVMQCIVCVLGIGDVV